MKDRNEAVEQALVEYQRRVGRPVVPGDVKQSMALKAEQMDGFRAGAAWAEAACREETQTLRDALCEVLTKWEECRPSISAAEALAYEHGWRHGGPGSGMRDVIIDAHAVLAEQEAAGG